jgi:hypothetical protein
MLQQHAISIARPVNGCVDAVQHANKVFSDFVIPEANDTISSDSSQRVLFPSLALLTSLPCCDPSSSITREVGDIRTNRNLLTKVRAARFHLFEMPPK